MSLVMEMIKISAGAKRPPWPGAVANARHANAVAVTKSDVSLFGASLIKFKLTTTATATTTN